MQAISENMMQLLVNVDYKLMLTRLSHSNTAFKGC